MPEGIAIQRVSSWSGPAPSKTKSLTSAGASPTLAPMGRNASRSRSTTVGSKAKWNNHVPLRFASRAEAVSKTRRPRSVPTKRVGTPSTPGAWARAVTVAFVDESAERTPALNAPITSPFGCKSLPMVHTPPSPLAPRAKTCMLAPSRSRTTARSSAGASMWLHVSIGAKAPSSSKGMICNPALDVTAKPASAPLTSSGTRSVKRMA